MDKIRIEHLETQTIIGVCDHERSSAQPLVIDIEMEADFTNAIMSDHLDDALDYDRITQLVRQYCESSRFALLEALAGGIIKHIQSEHSEVDKVGVLIRKPKALKGAMASAWCERTREEMQRLELMACL